MAEFGSFVYRIPSLPSIIVREFPSYALATESKHNSIHVHFPPQDVTQVTRFLISGSLPCPPFGIMEHGTVSELDRCGFGL
jgi:hypothetical protein